MSSRRGAIPEYVRVRTGGIRIDAGPCLSASRNHDWRVGELHRRGSAHEVIPVILQVDFYSQRGLIRGIYRLKLLPRSVKGFPRHLLRPCCHQKQGERGGAGSPLIAVDQKAVSILPARNGKAKEVLEHLRHKHRSVRVDHVQVEVVALSVGEVVRMRRPKRSGVSHRALVAGVLAGMNDGPLFASWTAI